MTRTKAPPYERPNCEIDRVPARRLAGVAEADSDRIEGALSPRPDRGRLPASGRGQFRFAEGRAADGRQRSRPGAARPA